MDRRRQGDAGELSAMSWYAQAGFAVFVPIGHSPDADFIAQRDGQLSSVQVKTTGQRRRGRWEVAICTRGGNRSWSGVAKHFSANRCDELFVVTVDGRRWRLPASAIDATSSLTLGGAKYAEHEVEPGLPLTAPPQRHSLSCATAAG